MTRRFFGTDGIRGPYGGPVVNEDFARRLGAAAAAWTLGREAAQRRVLIGRDTRESGGALLEELAAGLESKGLSVVDLGVLPTPAVALAVKAQDAALGVVITASHNPASDNGIKFFGPHGIKLTDDDEAVIESLLPDAVVPGKTVTTKDPAALGRYIDRVASLLPEARVPWRIVLDTANGATTASSGAILRRLGAEVISLGDQPDGRNINEGVGSEHPEAMCAAVKKHQARLGIAHDGDGDRCILCDEQGELLDGDEILTILALDALRRGRLDRRTLVVTVQSNLGVDAAVIAAGGRVVRTPVGDRYVIERMRQEGASLGGESSGHVICSDVSPTGDGAVAAIRVLEVMLTTNRPLSELRRELRKFPQRSHALSVREKIPLDRLPKLSAAIAALEAELAAQGRVLVRYSGTEAKLRFLVEGPDVAQVETGLGRLVAAASAELA